MAFPFLTVFIIFLLALFFRFKYLREKREAQEQDFWSNEQKARINIGTIKESDYVVIPLSTMEGSSQRPKGKVERGITT